MSTLKLLITTHLKPAKVITGKDLIACGFKPGKWFAEAIAHINSNGLEGEAMTSYLDTMKPADFIPLHENPVHYHENISATNEVEQANLDAVRKSMNELMRTPTIVAGAIMPDACPAGPVGTIPVGGIISARNAIHPGFHSADICCSLMLTNIGKVDPKTALDIAQQVSHFGPGGRGPDNPFELPIEILEEIKRNPLLNSEKSIKLAKEHLCTIGNGNHFVGINVSSKTGDTMIVTHYGSRGFGALLYKNGMRIAERFRREISPATPEHNSWIPYETPEGKYYWSALQTVRKWTKQNHICLHDEIIKRLSGKIVDRYWNEHNFVFKDSDLFYHAKGATPMSSKFMPDITGPRIIPLNMTQPILIVEGGTTETNLGFAPHGAGRNLSRSKHKHSKGNKSVDEIFEEETKGVDARFYFKNIDISELPSAYKNAEEVRRQITHFNLATVIDELTPYGSIMSGEEGMDAPWRKKKKNIPA